MDVFVIIFSIVWAGIGRFVKKYPETLAGYNTMTPGQKKNVDIQAAVNLIYNGFCVMAALMVVLYFLLRLLGQPIRIAISAGLFAPIFLGVPVLLVMFQKYDRNPRSRLKYYLTAGIILLLPLAAVVMYLCA